MGLHPRQQGKSKLFEKLDEVYRPENLQVHGQRRPGIIGFVEVVQEAGSLEGAILGVVEPLPGHLGPTFLLRLDV
jgi:hypothetical protein